MQGHPQRAEAYDEPPGEAEARQASGAAPALALVSAQVGEDFLARVVRQIMGEREETARGDADRLGRPPPIVGLLLGVLSSRFGDGRHRELLQAGTVRTTPQEPGTDSRAVPTA